MTEWLGIIEYREFSDLPRMFVVEKAGVLYLFDCAFDEQVDEYSEEYAVYEIPPSSMESRRADWNDLVGDGTRIGSTAVRDVVFDTTRRRQVLLNSLALPG